MGQSPGVVLPPTLQVQETSPTPSACFRIRPAAELGPDLYITAISQSAPGDVWASSVASLPRSMGEVSELISTASAGLSETGVGDGDGVTVGIAVGEGVGPVGGVEVGMGAVVGAGVDVGDRVGDGFTVLVGGGVDVGVEAAVGVGDVVGVGWGTTVGIGLDVGVGDWRGGLVVPVELVGTGGGRRSAVGDGAGSYGVGPSVGAGCVMVGGSVVVVC